ncbi:MAG: NAD(P)/FAD-dependent oxidoreductase [bacterium]|nr:NAD(P)/FAD-dependent oxidoreductase [bacterium]
MSKVVDVCVIGHGISGGVCANRLRRAGLSVMAIEKKERVGGACYSARVEIEGRELVYPAGATVLGMMQDFVYKETGLANRLQIFAPDCAKIVFLPSFRNPLLVYDDPTLLAKELARTTGERGDVEGFRRDSDLVVAFLREGYRKAEVPTLESACERLGPELTKLWITGSAQDLLDHYFTSDAVKVYMGMTVIESCGTSYHAPFSAFTIPLMDSGSIFDGYWGFVKGGLWKLTETLGDINREIGVDVVTSAEVTSVDPKSGYITYRKGHDEESLVAKHIVFGTDPLTAGRLVGRNYLVRGKKSQGTSGKLILAFRSHVQWKHTTYEPEAFRFIFAAETLEEIDRRSQSVTHGKVDFAPGYIQIYCEGAGQRRLGLRPSFDILVAYFKNMSGRKSGEEMPEVREYVKDQVLSQIYNPEALVWDRLLTPHDLEREFGLPGGNIDHLDLCEGQQAWQRTLSNDPRKSFYQFGDLENVFICSAGVYPCGSVSGTGGYMCAQEILRLMEKKR